MPYNYKLTYFNGRGRAEAIRLVFAQAGVQYEDKRIAKEEWGVLKPNTPFGYLPILEVDGKVLSGSSPILRFVAERHGLAGANDVENAEIAGIADCLMDFMVAFMKVRFEKDEARKAELRKQFDDETVPKYLTALSKHVSPEGWLYGPKITYADIAFFNFAAFHDHLSDEQLSAYPKLKKINEKVGALPNIAKYVKERPDTPF